MSVTLADLRDDIVEHTSDFISSNDTNRIDKAINRARERIAEIAKVSDLLFTDTITTSAGVNSYTISTRFLSEYYVYNKDSNVGIIPVWIPDTYIEEKVFSQLPSEGAPQGYQIRGDKIIFYPTPDKAYTIEILSYHYPITLVNATDTDYLNDKARECIVNGALYRLFTSVGSIELSKYHFDLYNYYLDIFIDKERDTWLQKLQMFKRRFAEKNLPNKVEFLNT